MSARLAPSLRALLELAADADSARADSDVVQVAVKFTGDVADLRARGFTPWTVRRHPTDGWAIASGPMPLGRVGELGELDHVVKVEGSPALTPELDRSVDEIGAKGVQAGGGTLTGAGVVIGIIDSGFDISHQSLRRPDGTTRILGLWDQSPPAGATGSAPAAFPGVGIEYTEAQIDAHLDGSAPGSVLVRDTTGHGTHVAGIAGGDGSQSGNCRGAFTYVGVAPAADLLLVRISAETAEIGESLNLQNAFDWIWRHPRVMGVQPSDNRPVVVNLSQGDNLGPHDGTSLVEQAIDLDLIGNPRRAVVKSAGNEGDERHHAAAALIAGASVDIDFTVGGDDRSTRHLELWYPGSGSLRATVLAPQPPGAARPGSAPLDPGDPVQRWNPVPGTTVRMESLTNDPDNGDNSLHLRFSASGALPAGGWTLRLQNTAASPVTLDAWLDRGVGSPVFTSHVLRERTISIPGTSAEVITVGSYSQSGFLFFDWTGDLADSSSRGPTRDGRVKPDISAPGVGITSAKAAAVGGCWCDCCYDFYVAKSGTSMAAPHVAGAVALIFEKNPDLTCAQVKQHLMTTARVPDGLSPGDMPTSDWGAGKLDVGGAVARAPAGGTVTPPPPSPGPPPPVPLRDPVPVPPGGLAPDLVSLLAGTEEGGRWAALVSRHFSEVRSLIDADRRLAVRWRRMDGPAVVWALARLASPASAGATPAVDWAHARREAAAFLAALRERASPGLVADIDRHGPALLRADLAALAAGLAGARRAA